MGDREDLFHRFHFFAAGEDLDVFEGALLVSALRHVTATRAGIVAMLEPVVGVIVAWIWLGESLAGVQLAGAAVVIAAIFLAQSAR